MMRSVVEDGTGQRAKALGVPVAGKTGTAAESRDAWFAGFTEDQVAIAWVGFDTPKPMKSESGGKAALPIWLAAMKAARGREGPVADPSIAPTHSPFTPPPSVSVRTIDKATGLLAPPFVIDAEGIERPPAPDTLMQEYFIPGTEPTEFAPALAEAKADILLDLYGDEPADAELDGFNPSGGDQGDQGDQGDEIGDDGAPSNDGSGVDFEADEPVGIEDIGEPIAPADPPPAPPPTNEDDSLPSL
jgi:penicillin-binding protein 1A